MGHPAKSQNKFILVKIVLKTVLNQLWNDAPPSYPIQQSAKKFSSNPSLPLGMLFKHNN